MFDKITITTRVAEIFVLRTHLNNKRQSQRIDSDAYYILHHSLAKYKNREKRIKNRDKD